jgi:group I intron endonuclease
MSKTIPLTQGVKQSGIYRIVQISTGRAYVGQSVDIRRRWVRHRYDLKAGRHASQRFQRTWSKYGPDAFRFEVLEECPPEHLTEREQWWMDHSSSVFNLIPSAGSCLGRPVSAETRAKISATLMGHPGHRRSPKELAKLSERWKGNDYAKALKGRKLSEEHKANVRAAWTPERRAAQSRILKGKPHSPEWNAAISAAHQRPETRAKKVAALKARVVSTETRAKIGASKLGNTYGRGKTGSLGTKRTSEVLAKMRTAQRARRERERTEREIA